MAVQRTHIRFPCDGNQITQISSGTIYVFIRLLIEFNATLSSGDTWHIRADRHAHFLGFYWVTLKHQRYVKALWIWLATCAWLKKRLVHSAVIWFTCIHQINCAKFVWNVITRADTHTHNIFTQYTLNKTLFLYCVSSTQVLCRLAGPFQHCFLQLLLSQAVNPF